MATLKGKAGFDRFCAKLPRQLADLARGAGRAAGEIIADEVKLLTPSDTVRRNVRIGTSEKNGKIVVAVRMTKGKTRGARWARSLATWLEWGTKPHVISVEGGQYLEMSVRKVNTSEKSGSLVIGNNFVGTTVRHPGARPHPAFRPAIDTKESEAMAAARAYIKSHVTRSGIKASAEPAEQPE